MTHSLRITLFGIVILMLGILITLTLTPTPAEAATCNLYSAATAVPQGYGASYNVFNTSQLLVSLSCNDTTVTVTAGDNDPYTYVYNQGYIYKNNAWTPYSLSCSGGESLISGAWCPKQAKATINNAPQDATNYILAYTCQWRTDAWKCGCKDTTCSTGLWQLQAYPPAQTTPPPTLNGTIFNDDFESGDNSKSEHGFSWGSGKNVTVSSERPKNGSYGLKFRFPAVHSEGNNYSDAEMRFKLGGHYPELWIKYDLYIPSNYYHRNSGGPGAYNNKALFHLWGGNYGSPGAEGPKLGPHYWPTGSNGESSVSMFAKAYINDKIVFNENWNCGTCGDGKSSHGVVADDKGHWMNIVIHVKYASASNDDGITEVWKTNWHGNTEKLIDIQDGPWYSTAPDGSKARGFDQGYLFGWANSGFVEETVLYIDNVTFSTESLR